MFTWICPKCGYEVPPSYSECPRCTGQLQHPAPAAVPPQQPQAAQPAAAPPQYVPQTPPPPPHYEAPPQQSYAPPPPPPPPSPTYTLPEQKRGMPGWLVMILVAGVLGGGFFGIYKYTSHAAPAAGSTAATKLQQPDAESGAGHAYAKVVEVTGIRLIEDSNQKVKLRYVVVNHSRAELAGLGLEITIGTDDANTPPIAIIKADVGTVAPDGTKEMEAPVNTKLRAYELPDWQFLRAKLVVTTP